MSVCLSHFIRKPSGHIYEYDLLGTFENKNIFSTDLKRGFYLDLSTNSIIFFDGDYKVFHSNENQFFTKYVIKNNKRLPQYNYLVGYILKNTGYYPSSNTEPEDMYWFWKKYGVENLDMAQFGVYIGHTTKIILNGADRVNKPWRKIYALDSFFGGFPKETEGIPTDEHWYEGGLSLHTKYNKIDDVINMLNNKLKKNIEYVVGYYKDSLTQELANRIGEYQLSFVDIDCDLHSSTVEVLDFLFSNRLMCIGCIIRFDDFIGTCWHGGERLALLQATDKYKFKLSNLSDNLFILENY